MLDHGGGSADDFARIDIVSNHTVFRDPALFRALMQGHALPVSTFSSFIHEATHHWCFISPVGTALSLLYLSAAKTALRWLRQDKGDDAELHRALDDLQTFDIALQFLRPLNEGLAQFAEYDVRPSETVDLVSPPLRATLGHLFQVRSRLEVKPEEWTRASYGVMDDITRWRVCGRTINRKSELLLQPVGAGASPYLLGYLAVKQLWRNSARFYEELGSSDVFLLFIRKVVFGDYALVAELLDSEHRPQARAMKFAMGLHARLQTIRLMLMDEDVPWSEWQRLISVPDDDNPGGLQIADPVPFAALDTTERVKQGLELQRRRFRQAADLEWYDDELQQVLHPDAFFDVIRERYLLWLGNTDGRWEPTGPKRGRVLSEGELLFDNYELQEASEEGLDALRLDSYIDLYRGFQVTTLASERGVFGFATRNTMSESVRTDVLKTRLDRARIVRTTGVLQSVISTVTSLTNYAHVMNGFWTPDMHDLLLKTYIGFASDFDARVEKTLVSGGLVEVFEGDPDQVRNVAAISLGASAELSPEGLAELSDVPLDPSAAIRRLRASWPVDSYPLASTGPDGFLASVI